MTYLDKNEIDHKIEEFSDRAIQNKLLMITREVKYLLENDVSRHLNIVNVHERYNHMLEQKGYLTISGNIKYKLEQDIIEYYGHNFLGILDSDIDINNKYNWVKVMIRKSNRVIHPIRNILLIDFLAGSIKDFVDYESKVSKEYPCLNKFTHFI